MCDFLEGKEFYNLMQTYRHTPVVDQDTVLAAYEAIKRFIREGVKQAEDRARMGY